MLGYEPPEPKYWKALTAALCVALPAAFLSHEILPASPLWIWLGGAVALAAIMAYNMHRKARYDGDAQWRMNFARFDRATQVRHDVEVRDE
jgi:hypothetical protein